MLPKIPDNQYGKLGLKYQISNQVNRDISLIPLMLYLCILLIIAEIKPCEQSLHILVPEEPQSDSGEGHILNETLVEYMESSLQGKCQFNTVYSLRVV